MDILKKNIPSLLCGIVVIIAVVAIFWPIGGMYGDLQADVQKSADSYKELDTTRKTARVLPSLVLEPGAEKTPLDRLPNDKIIAIGVEKTKALTAQRDLMLKTVSDLNVHPLLQERALPRPEGRDSFDFVEKYLEQLGEGPEEWKAGLPAELNAASPPSPEDINEVARKVWDEKFAIRIYELAGKNNQADIELEFQDEVMDLPERVKQQRASEHRIYLDYGSLPISQDVQRGKLVTAPQIWFAQTVLWIEQDVVKAINAANGNSKTVPTSPIKHLKSLRVPFSVDQYVRASATGATGEAAAVPLNADGVAELFSVSPTGRVCNDLYDVIHFELVLRVDYRKIPQILAEIERNRLFTVLSTGIAGVDAAKEQEINGYVYGNDPVAELTLNVEALFLRSWTVDKDHEFRAAIMPDLVMQSVGAKPGPGMQGGAGGYSPMPGASGESMEQ